MRELAHAAAHSKPWQMPASPWACMARSSTRSARFGATILIVAISERAALLDPAPVSPGGLPELGDKVAAQQQPLPPRSYIQESQALIPATTRRAHATGRPYCLGGRLMKTTSEFSRKQSKTICFPSWCDVEGPHGGTVLKPREWAGLHGSEIEQPEIL